MQVDDSSLATRAPLALPRWLVPALVGLGAVLRAPGFFVKLFTPDEATLATMASVVDKGGHLYTTVADRKPPAVPYLYAAAFRLTGSHDLRWVRVLALAFLVGTAWLLAREAVRRTGRTEAGVLCAFAFLLAYAAFFTNDAQPATFELFMLLPMTAAFVSAGKGHAVRAGLWLALACLCKQTAVATAIPVAYLLWRAEGGWRPVVRAGTAGGVLIATAALAFGPRRFLLWTVTGNGGYLSLQGSLWGVAGRGLVMTGALVTLNAAVVALAVRSARHHAVEVDVWLWLASAALAVVAGFRFYGHYYLQALPPLALAAALGPPLLDAASRRRAAIGMAVPAVAMSAVGFVPQGDTPTFPYRQIAARVDALTTPQETVFVWGDLPEVYWAANRSPGARFVHTGFLTGNSGGRANGSGTVADALPGAWQMLKDDVRQDPPDVIVDTSHAFIRQSEYYPMRDTPLWRVVVEKYRLVGTVGGVDLYRYKEPLPD